MPTECLESKKRQIIIEALDGLASHTADLRKLVPKEADAAFFNQALIKMGETLTNLSRAIGYVDPCPISTSHPKPRRL